MRILSIDVGIKNLAYCIIDANSDKTFSIKQWEVLNLCGEEPKCGFKTKKGVCDKKAKYFKEDNHYCKTHAKKTEYLIPTAELSPAKLKKKKLNDLIEFAKLYEIKFDPPARKDKLHGIISNYLKNILLDTVTVQSANALDLIQLGILLRDKLDTEIDVKSIDRIIIENQISPIANRMKCLQGMISQYFIMRGNENVSFVSASNKLKPFIQNRKTTYSERKKLGIDISKGLLAASSCEKQWIDKMKTHKKNDDLADAYLMTRFYINKILHLK